MDYNQHGRLHPELPPYVVVNGGSRHPGAGALSAACAPMPLSSASKGLPYQQPTDPAEYERYHRRLALSQELGKPFMQKLGERSGVKAYQNLLS